MMEKLQRWCGEIIAKFQMILSGDAERAVMQRPMFKIAWIVVVVAGGLWTVIQFADWYSARNELSDMATSYIETARLNFTETGNATVSCSLAEKAIAINPNAPEARYWHVYFRAMRTIEEISAVDNVITEEEDRKVDELWGEINLLKRQFPYRKEAILLAASLNLVMNKFEETERLIRDVDVPVEYKPWAECILARSLYGQTKINEAYDVATNSVARFPDSKWSHFALAKVQLKRQNWVEARNQLDRCLAIDENFTDAMDRKAYCLLYGLPCRPAEARKVLRKLIKLQPGHSSAYAEMVQSYLLEGKSAMAVLYGRKAVSLFPKFLDGYRLLIDALSADGYNQEAIELADKVVEMDPTNPYNYFTKFMLLLDAGKYAEAIKVDADYFDISKEMDDSEEISDAAWGLFLLGTKYDTALEMVEEAIAIDGKTDHRDDDIWDTKAWLLLRLGRTSEALKLHAEVMNGAYGENKSRMEVYHARMLRMIGKFQEAEAFLVKARERLPEYWLLNSELAFCSIGEKRYDDADRYIKKGLSLKMPTARKCEFRLACARMAFEQGDFSKAADMQCEALKKTGNRITEVRLALLDYAKYCRAAKRSREFNDTILKLQQIDPNEAELKRLIASTDPKEAR